MVGVDLEVDVEVEVEQDTSTNVDTIKQVNTAQKAPFFMLTSLYIAILLVNPLNSIYVISFTCINRNR